MMQLGFLLKSATPSPAQIEAGNYSKDHLSLHGLRISIENPKGSVRSGKDRDGKPWSIVMKNDYGYIRGYKGADKEQVDVYVGPHPESEKVFIVNQMIDGRFDEHKCMMGFLTEEEAKQAYVSNYTKGWRGLGGIKEKSIEEFKRWLEEGNLTRAAKAIRDLPLMPSKKNPAVMRHQDLQKQFQYRMRYRPPSSAAPKGWKMVARSVSSENPFGVIEFDKPLSKRDIDAYELDPLDPADPVNVMKRFKATREDVISRLDSNDSLAYQTRSGSGNRLLSPDTRRPGNYRITSFSSDGIPSGHIEYDDLGEAIDAVAREFGKQIDKSVRIILAVAPTLIKAVIKTPTMPGSGRVDWDAVPPGASVWITAKEGVLAGRHLLITKRADGQAVIDPGEARRHGYKMGSWADDAFKQSAGMAHASFQFGKLKEQKKDEERWKEYEQRREERAPYEAQLKEIRGKTTAQAHAVEEKFLESTGISKYGLSQTDKKIVRESASRQALDQGMEQDLADAYGKTVARVRDQIEKRFKRDAALRRLKYYQKALELLGEKKLLDAKEPELAGATDEPQTSDPNLDLQALGQLAAAENQPLEIEAPAVPLTATTPQEVENAVAEDLIKKTAEAKKRREENIELKEEARTDAIILRAVEEGQDPLDKLIRTQDRESAKAAVDAFQELTRAKAERAEVMKIIPPKLPRPETVVVANAIEQMRMRAVEAVDDVKIKEAERRYREQNKLTLDDSFYAVVHEHWNETDGYLINGGIQEGATDYLNGILKKKTGFVSSSAAAALTGLVGRHTGLEMDVGRLTQAFSPGVAASIVGHWLVDLARKRQIKDKSISGIIDAIEQSNAEQEGGLLAMEKKALDRNRELKESYEEIKRQKSNGELSAEATIMRLEAENILQRRENMGKAYGSLSASGTLLLAMKHAQRGIDEKLSVNVGMSKDNAYRILETLGVKADKLPEGMSITHNILGSDEQGQPVIQYQISANASIFAQRWGKTQPIVTKETKELDKIKSNANPVVGTDNPPHFKKLWKNDLGQEEMFNLRPSQRNDINFLNKLGGGLITRSTGAGKTLTALGHISHRLQSKPNGKHLIMVPDGLVDQWHDQGTRATDLNILKISEKQTKEQRAKLWASVKGGHTVIISHSDALKAQSDVDAIVNGGFESATIDEPQKLKSQASEKLGTQAKRIINVPFEGRIGLSATPARESMDEIYDWVNWSTKEYKGNDKRGRPMYSPKIGSKVGFGRMYAGAGAGTNAQDEAIQKMIFDKLGPYISGDEFKVREGYKLNVNNGGGFDKPTRVKRTEAQIAKQKEIEAGYGALKSQIETEEKAKAKKSGKGNFYVQHRVSHRIAKEMQKRHWDNLHGGESNGKTEKVLEGIQKHIKEGRKTHVVYVDSDAQRVSIGQALRKQKFKNIYDLTELNKRAKFKDEAESISKQSGTVSFTTSKGSTYQSSGTTTSRDKAARPEHPGDEGPQPKSERTYYLSKDDMEKLGLLQTKGGPKMRLAETSDGKLGVQYAEGKDKGKFERRTVVPFQNEPRQGLHPVESWKGGEEHHFGNEIVKVEGSKGGISPEEATGHVIGQRKEQWAAHKEKGEPSFIFIDRTSQAGHNLQKADVLSLAGRPEDAAALFQIMGRGDRSPREGDFNFDAYRYSDSPWEDNHWEELSNQMKIVRSITPALTKSVVGIAVEAVTKAIMGSRIAAFFGMGV